MNAQEIRTEIEKLNAQMDAISDRLTELEAEQNVFCPEFEKLLSDSRKIEKIKAWLSKANETVIYKTVARGTGESGTAKCYLWQVIDLFDPGAEELVKSAMENRGEFVMFPRSFQGDTLEAMNFIRYIKFM